MTTLSPMQKQALQYYEAGALDVAALQDFLKDLPAPCAIVRGAQCYVLTPDPYPGSRGPIINTLPLYVGHDWQVS